MYKHKNSSVLITCLVAFFLSGCTKLDQELNSTLTNDQAANALGTNGTALLLQTAYTDIGPILIWEIYLPWRK
jgi:hypothetical protein